MDDVGIDQMRAFGYGVVDPAKAPNIETVAQQGLRFRNTWAMPECSPSRAMVFTGRYPLRTSITNASSNERGESRAIPHTPWPLVTLAMLRNYIDLTEPIASSLPI